MSFRAVEYFYPARRTQYDNGAVTTQILELYVAVLVENAMMCFSIKNREPRGVFDANNPIMLQKNNAMDRWGVVQARIISVTVDVMRLFGIIHRVPTGGCPTFLCAPYRIFPPFFVA